MLRNDQPGPHPELKFYSRPEALNGIIPTPTTITQRIDTGYARNLIEFLIKSPKGVEDVRRIAEETANTQRTMEVLQVGNEAPFKAIFFQRDIRPFGDYLVYGSRRHPAPDIRSTIIADDDYIHRMIENPNVVGEDSQFDIFGRVLSSIMDVDIDRNTGELLKDYYTRLREPLQRGYDAKKESGQVAVRVGPSPVDELRKAYREGKRYDVVFPDIPGDLDRMNYIQMVQATLSENGCAFVPLTWWYIPGLDNRRRMMTLLDDTVATKAGEIDLEQYLAMKFPEAYSVVDDPGVKMLIIRGTNPPVQLPDFDVSRRRSSATHVSLQWKIKASEK